MLPAGILVPNGLNGNFNTTLQPSGPRYNVNTASSSASHSMAGPTTDMLNTLSHPNGPEYQLSVGEGVYTVKDSLLLGTPPANPSDAPAVTPNPLLTTPSPAKAGTKLSICIINPRHTPPVLYKSPEAESTKTTLGSYSLKEHEKESRSSHESRSEENNTPKRNGGIFGQENPLLTTSVGKEGLKRKKPKTNLVKSNSQLISRVIVHDQLQKRLQDHSPEGTYVFANIDRAFQWLDLSSPENYRAQPLMKIIFAKAHILCHDINHFTKSANHIDVILGANTGDIVWFEAFSQKYLRINKANVISPSPITEIRWLPGSENLFLASHMDGTLIVYDKEREDATFVPENNNGTSSLEVNGNTPSALQPLNGESQASPSPLHINKSITSKNQRANPVSSWRLSNHRITAFAFSPLPLRYLAVVSEDGCLRIVNYAHEALTDLYPSYYGGFTCVCWSPDGKYVLTGGQDDLVTLWSLHERRIVARCQGHRSWVTCVAFDPWRSCDGRNYRFGSVGEDRRLLLWDFNVGMLRRPKTKGGVHRGNKENRASVSSYAMGHIRRPSQLTNRMRSNSSLPGDLPELDMDDGCQEHEVESRIVTAELPAVMSKIVDDHRMSWLGFEEDCIVTACAEGHIRTWMRPSDVINSNKVTVS